MGNKQDIQLQNDAEISLYDIFEFIKNGWRGLIIFGGAGALVGLAIALTLPTKYEASMNFLMAKAAGMPVEPAAALIARMKLPLFFPSDTIKACNMQSELEPGRALGKALKPTINDAASFIQLKFQADSPQLATACLESVYLTIKKEQETQAKPLLDEYKLRLKFVEQRLEQTIKLQDGLAKRTIDLGGVTNVKLDSSFLWIIGYNNLQQSIDNYQGEITDLKSKLAPPQTTEVGLVEPIYAPEIEVTSGRTMTVLVSALMGMLVGTIFLMLKKTWKNQES